MNAYRQAAMVVANLDRHSADDLLERMCPEQARAIRDELVLLDGLSAEESNEAIGHFLARPESCSVDTQSPAGDGMLSDRDGEVDSSGLSRTWESNVKDELLQHDDVEIAEVIRNERSPVVTALLRSLPAKRAARVLRSVPRTLQRDVLANLDHGQLADDQVIEAICDQICEQLADRRTKSHETATSALHDIFVEFDNDEKEQLLSSLADENPMLAQRLLRFQQNNHDRPAAFPSDKGSTLS